MPDQVRHDGQNLNAFYNYDTVSFAGMTGKRKKWLFTKLSMFKSFDPPEADWILVIGIYL
jgi:hypothetical protein